MIRTFRQINSLRGEPPRSERWNATLPLGEREWNVAFDVYFVEKFKVIHLHCPSLEVSCSLPSPASSAQFQDLFLGELDAALRRGQLDHVIGRLLKMEKHAPSSSYLLSLDGRAAYVLSDFLWELGEFKSALLFYESDPESDPRYEHTSLRRAVLDAQETGRPLPALGGFMAVVTREWGQTIKSVMEKGTEREINVLQHAVAMHAYFRLMEQCLHMVADWSLATESAKGAEAYRFTAIKELGLENQEVIYLLPEWASQIGHLAMLAWLVSAQQLGELPQKRLCLLAPSKGTANSFLMNAYREAGYMDVITDDEKVKELLPLATVTGWNLNMVFPMRDSGHQFFINVMGSTFKKWEQAGRGPLLKISEPVRRAGEAVLSALGMPKDAWYVCIHGRDLIYHKEKFLNLRNYDIATLNPAVDRIIEQGGWVVRLGEPGSRSLAARERYIDYPSSWSRAGWVDVFFLGTCSSFISCSSGIIDVTEAYHTWNLWTNYITYMMPPYHPKRLFLLKRIWLVDEKRYITFREMFSRDWLNYLGAFEHFKMIGAEAVENTAEEILEAYIELESMRRGEDTRTSEDLERQRRFEAIMTECGHLAQGCGRIGAAFLRRHQDLLG